MSARSRRFWAYARSLILPVGAYWGATAVSFGIFAAAIVFTEGGTDENLGILAMFGVATAVGVLLGQLAALARVRTWFFFTTAGISWLIGMAAAGYLTSALGDVAILFAVFAFLVPIFAIAGLWSLRVHMGLLATWGPAMYITGTIIAISEHNGSDAQWFAGNKWAIWDVMTAPVLLLGVGLVVLYLASRELHRLSLWRFGPGGPDVPAVDAAAKVKRARALPGCGGVFILGVLIAVLTVAAALVSPYLWRTGPGDRDGDGGEQSEDYDGDGVPDEAEDANGDGDLNNDDTDGDGTPDYQDGDDDGDGVSTSEERGKSGRPKDTDGDGIPDHRDTDDDGDGVPTDEEAPGGSSQDTDGDGTPDHQDRDDDGDGANTDDEDPNGNGQPQDDDSDGDGTPDYLDGPPPKPQSGCDKDQQQQQEQQDKADRDPTEQVVEAVKQTGLSLLFLFLALFLAVVGIFTFAPPLRRTLLLQHLRRPLWPVPPTRKVQQSWRLVEIALADAGVHPRPGDSPTGLAARAAEELKDIDPEPILEAARAAERVAYGYGLNPDDTERVRRLAEMAYQASWESMSEWQKIVAVYRWL
ncbi:MAG: DUF4129 domain-containing protein [Deltaproteobacteria bacterium]|nr:DUF4129 domain-containing protein [Deltaproteobacteria bacterium]